MKFISEITPFFYGRPLLYVDIGAYKGKVYRSLVESDLTVHEAHLIEPNPKSFKLLQEMVAALGGGEKIHCHNVAIGAERGAASILPNGTMSKVRGAEGTSPALDEQHEVRVETLDALSRVFGRDRISILKIDCEGDELSVLDGAHGLLEREAIDLIQLEAGVQSSSDRLTDFGAIEARLGGYGYKLFRIFEQKNGWDVDSPALRRMNVAFMSRRFAGDNPFKVTKELFAARKRCDELSAQRDLAQQERDLALKERDSARSAANAAQ